MTLINPAKDKEALEFAQRAAEHFRDHCHCFTYADGDPESGALMAIRWNPYTVLVVRLHEEEAVRLYSSHCLIQQDFPKLEPTW